MDSDTLKVWAAFAGPVIAVGSLGYNIYQARLIRSQTPVAEQKQEIRDALRAIIAQFDNSIIFTVAPHIEYWDRGFSSLRDARLCLSTSNSVIKHAKSSLVPDNIKLFVNNVLDEISRVYAYHDSFRQLQKDRTFVPFEEITTWRDKIPADTALNSLQSYVRQNRPMFEKFIAGL